MNLTSKRKEKGLTLTELAKLVGVDKSYLSRIEHGTTPMSLKVRKKLIELELIKESHTSSTIGDISDFEFKLV